MRPITSGACEIGARKDSHSVDCQIVRWWCPPAGWPHDLGQSLVWQRGGGVLINRTIANIVVRTGTPSARRGNVGRRIPPLRLFTDSTRACRIFSRFPRLMNRVLDGDLGRTLQFSGSVMVENESERTAVATRPYPAYPQLQTGDRCP